MSERLQPIKQLKKWKDYDKQKITNILRLADTLNIQNADDDLIESQWFAITMKLRNKLKKMDIKSKEPQQKPPSLKKIPSIILQPNNLYQGIRQSQKSIIRVLWKNFSANFKQQHLMNPKCVQFIKQVVIELRIIYQNQLDSKKQKRIDSICMHLANQNSTLAKIQMIQGKISAKLVAQDHQSAYVDEQTKIKNQKALNQQFAMSQMGFYDNMKKTIFSKSQQQCRFCKNKTAYCDDMKQIRAADQPMTRFMKCNTCNRNWRD